MKKILLFILISLCPITLCSCEKQKLPQDDTKQTTENDLANTSLSDNAIIAQYADKLSDNRVNIADYKNIYSSETEELKKNGSDKLSFDSCEFYPIDDVNSVSALTFPEHNLTPKESLTIIKNWLKSLNITEIDTKEQIRDASGQYEKNEEMEYPFNYPAVSAHYPDFKTGNGFFLNTNLCYIQMGNTGIYSMSDGTITKFLKLKSFAAMDALGVNSEDIVKTGKVSELGDEVWQLLSGKVKIKDAADMAQKYFEKGTPYPPAEGVTVYIPAVSVFRLNDKYGYAFEIRRKYQGIPLAGAQLGESRYYDNRYSIAGDTKQAYVVNNITVCGYTGHIEATEMKQAIKDQEAIISLKEAVSILNEKLASQINVDLTSVELVYCPCTFDETGEEKFCFPCWEFSGINTNDQRNIKIYLDILTGEIYYYTYAG